MDLNFVLRRCENAICDHKSNDFPFIMIIFNTTTCTPIQNHFCSPFSLKLNNFATKASDASNVKPDVLFTKNNLSNYIDSVGEKKYRPFIFPKEIYILNVKTIECTVVSY